MPSKSFCNKCIIELNYNSGWKLESLESVATLTAHIVILMIYNCFLILMFKFLSSFYDNFSLFVPELVVELYQKMLKSLEARTMPPNAWLWSLIASCSNREDIKLLFEMLQKLRIFVSHFQT